MTTSSVSVKLALEALDKIQYQAEWDWGADECNLIRTALTTPSTEDDFVKELRAENERLRLSEAEHALQYKFLQDKIYDITNNKDE